MRRALLQLAVEALLHLLGEEAVRLDVYGRGRRTTGSGDRHGNRLRGEVVRVVTEQVVARNQGQVAAGDIGSGGTQAQPVDRECRIVLRGDRECADRAGGKAPRGEQAHPGACALEGEGGRSRRAGGGAGYAGAGQVVLVGDPVPAVRLRGVADQADVAQLAERAGVEQFPAGLRAAGNRCGSGQLHGRGDVVPGQRRQVGAREPARAVQGRVEGDHRAREGGNDETTEHDPGDDDAAVAHPHILKCPAR